MTPIMTNFDTVLQLNQDLYSTHIMQYFPDSSIKIAELVRNGHISLHEAPRYDQNVDNCQLWRKYALWCAKKWEKQYSNISLEVEGGNSVSVGACVNICERHFEGTETYANYLSAKGVIENIFTLNSSKPFDQKLKPFEYGALEVCRAAIGGPSFQQAASYTITHSTSVARINLPYPEYEAEKASHYDKLMTILEHGEWVD